jgi:hypothetical protein
MDLPFPLILIWHHCNCAIDERSINSSAPSMPLTVKAAWVVITSIFWEMARAHTVQRWSLAVLVPINDDACCHRPPLDLTGA